MDPETCPCPTGEPPPPSCGTAHPFTGKESHAPRCCSCCPAECEKCAKDCVCKGGEGAEAEAEKCSCCQ
uniref:Metallothionein n=1 Tax=Marmota marmota marmota TaxID=9994 RepID=A0A8C5ZB41_MARMA